MPARCRRQALADAPPFQPTREMRPIPSKERAWNKRYLCYANFPRCDENELSLPMCASVCANFMRACGMDKELRSFCEAGATAAAVAGGDNEEELPPVTTAFPGQPFVQNKWRGRGRGQPDIVCTPSVKSGSAEKHPMGWLVVSFLVAGLCGVV